MDEGEASGFNPTRIFATDMLAMVLHGDADKGAIAFMFQVQDQRPAFLLDIGPVSPERRQQIEAVAERLLQLIGQTRQQ